MENSEVNAVLELEPTRVLPGDLVEAAAVLQGPNLRHRLWWRIPVAHRDALTGWSDPFVIAFLFVLMNRNSSIRELRIAAPVSPSLLENLETYMRIWHSWLPGQYAPVEIRGDLEGEQALAPERPWIVPFSGGVDSCFTLFQHKRNLAGRRTRALHHAAVFNGFDIWHDEPEQVFTQLRKGVEEQLGLLKVGAIPMDSNFHELPTAWGHSHGTHLISGLALLSRGFAGTLVPNNFAFHQPFRVWGSMPLIDRHLSSGSFAVMDDGAELSRIEKLRVLAAWPEGLRHLRVCYSNPGSAANCCVCEKCIRNILACRIAGLGLPPCFARDVTEGQIRAMRFHTPMLLDYWCDLLRGAEERGLGGESWVRALRGTVRRAQRRAAWGRFATPYLPLRNRIRTFFRGSAESRSSRARAGGVGVAAGEGGKPISPAVDPRGL
jgi:hypothetical protein